MLLPECDGFRYSVSFRIQIIYIEVLAQSLRGLWESVLLVIGKFLKYSGGQKGCTSSAVSGDLHLVGVQSYYVILWAGDVGDKS